MNFGGVWRRAGSVRACRLDLIDMEVFDPSRDISKFAIAGRDGRVGDRPRARAVAIVMLAEMGPYDHKSRMSREGVPQTCGSRVGEFAKQVRAVEDWRRRRQSARMLTQPPKSRTSSLSSERGPAARIAAAACSAAGPSLANGNFQTLWG